MIDPCLSCRLPDCDEDSIECALHVQERVDAAVLACIKDASMQVIRAELAVRDAKRCSA